MKHRSEGATATLLGMPGFVVGAQLEVDGEIWLQVETTAEVVGTDVQLASAGRLEANRAYGTRAVGHGRPQPGEGADLRCHPPPGGPPGVVLVWAKAARNFGVAPAHRHADWRRLVEDPARLDASAGPDVEH